jgi:hypothetical protein
MKDAGLGAEPPGDSRLAEIQGLVVLDDFIKGRFPRPLADELGSSHKQRSASCLLHSKIQSPSINPEVLFLSLFIISSTGIRQSLSPIQPCSSTNRRVLSVNMTSLTIAALLLAAAPAAMGHGFLAKPAARNVVMNSDYCPQCLAAGTILIDAIPRPLTRPDALTRAPRSFSRWTRYGVPVG